MNKVKFIFIMIIIFLIVSLLTYLNYDKILKYFTNKQWELADSIGKIEIENCIDTFGTSSTFFTINGSGIQGYSDSAKKVFDQSIPFKEVVTSTAGDYAIVAEKNATNAYVICKNEKVWDTNINSGNILGVAINKNGYSAIIYSQSGYKSLVKVFSSKGEELFTSYLASTYAIDVAISNDNKTLAIAEIDTNGVNLTSAIKLVNIQSASESTVEKYDIEGEEVISDIEYTENNQLLILTDDSAKVLKGNKLFDIVHFKEENIIIANISNHKNLVAVKIEEESLFTIKCDVCIYSTDSSDIKKYEIDETPNKVVACSDMIAVDTGSKILFVNTSGSFVKKCEYNGQLKDIKLFDNGKEAVLIFRDTAELIKVGGV